MLRLVVEADTWLRNRGVTFVNDSPKVQVFRLAMQNSMRFAGQLYYTLPEFSRVHSYYESIYVGSTNFAGLLISLAATMIIANELRRQN